MDCAGASVGRSIAFTMSIRFYRRFRAGPFRLNVSKRGVSASVGTKGAWFTVGNGRVRVRRHR
jgi:hypothetical protein